MNPDERRIRRGNGPGPSRASGHRVDEQELERHLKELAEALIRAVEVRVPEVREGAVATIAGPPPYRRLDGRGRTFAFVRVRPKKRLVRVDLTGRWRPPAVSRLALASASAFTLAIRSRMDIPDAVDFLARTFAGTPP